MSKQDLIKAILARCKRKNERLAIPLIMSYKIAKAKNWSNPIMIDNISGGGLKFHTPKRIKQYSKIELKIDIPNKLQPITVKGNVIWCTKILNKKQPKKSKYEIGVEFLKMQNRDRQEFVSYLCEEILFQYLTNEGKVKPKWI